MKAVPIHQAKANLSKYIAQAKKGKPVYIGSHGQAEVVLTKLPDKRPKPLWGAMKGQFNFSEEEWEKATELVNKDFEDSLNKPDF